MTNDSKTLTTAMEGGGFYNRNSDVQAAGIALALPFLEKAALSISFGSGEPLVIADYGSSQGRNSMLPMRLAIKALRARAGWERVVEVVHIDQPSNDFASLFTALRDDPNSYLAGKTGLFVSAVGRSYFDPILPPGRVHLGWTSWALQWMSRNPVDVPDHLFPSMGAVRFWGTADPTSATPLRAVSYFPAQN
jgi:SAM dependent carboxyl methyltransferase